MRKSKRRLLSAVLSVCMIFSVMTFPAYAEESTADASQTVQSVTSESNTAGESTGQADANVKTGDAGRDTGEEISVGEAAEQSKENNEETADELEKAGDSEVTLDAVGGADQGDTGSQDNTPAVLTEEGTDEDDVAADVPEGDGTSENPYQIGTADELYWFAGLVNGTLEDVTQDNDAWAVLTDDIVVNEGTMTEASTGAREWTPIGASNHSYRGTFDGDGHTVSGIYINGSSSTYRGLFGYIYGGTIKNLGVEESYVMGGSYTGMLVGYASMTTIENCYSSGLVKGQNSYVGGLIGEIVSTSCISNSYNLANVQMSSSYTAGGIAGYLGSGSSIDNCYNMGKISRSSGTLLSGGIVGYCYNLNDVENCYYLDTSANDGYNWINNGSDTIESKTEEQFRSGEVTLLLNNMLSSEECIWRQNLSGETADVYPVLNKEHSVIYIIGSQNCPASIMNMDGYSNSSEDDNRNIEHTRDSEGVCIYCSQDSEGTYHIKDKDALYLFAGTVQGQINGVKRNTTANAVLECDIVVNEDISGSDSVEEWIPLGDREHPYTGIFDGQGHTISGISCTEDMGSSYGYKGVFGYVSGGSVYDLGIVNSIIFEESFSSSVGGIAGYITENTTIENCYFDGIVVGNGSLGGIAGECESNSSIIDSYNLGMIGTDDYPGIVAGGIVAKNNGMINHCYNQGEVIFEAHTYDLRYIGGIAGENYGDVICCYNSGKVYSNISGNDVFEGEAYVGGVVGYNSNFIYSSYNTGEIGKNSVDGLYVGGVVGCSLGGVFKCYNTGIVNTVTYRTRSAGAIMGMRYLPSNGDFIGDCYYLSGTSERAIGDVMDYPEPKSAEIIESELRDVLSGNAVSNDPVEKSASQFASGEVAWLLNGENSEEPLIWHQNLSGSNKDSSPVLDETHAIVYITGTKKCPDAPIAGSVYNNSGESVKILGEHDYAGSTPCSGCGAFEPNYELPKEEGYYQIATADDLYWFASRVNGTNGLESAPDCCAELTADIVVNERVLNSDGSLTEDSASLREWEPIGYDSNKYGPNFYPEDIDYEKMVPYEGIFDGNGHTISGLYVDCTGVSFIGLFGLATTGAEIRNVTVVDSYFNGEGYSCNYGGIAGGIFTKDFVEDAPAVYSAESDSEEAMPEPDEIKFETVVENCGFEGIINAEAGAGGIVGNILEGITYIHGCYNTGDISARSIYDYNGYAGGIVGNFTWGYIEQCYNTGTVSGGDFTGGIAGSIDAVFARSCYNSGQIAYTWKETAGGIFGQVQNNFMCENCYYDNTIIAEGIGDYYDEIDLSGIIQGMPTEDFASGLVAWLLNGESNENPIWYQTLTVDPSPVLDSTHGIVNLAGTEDDPEFTNPEMEFTVKVTSRIEGAEGTVAEVTGGGTYNLRQSATVTAPAKEGFTFLGWFTAAPASSSGYKGDAVSNKLSYTFEVTEDCDLVAVYRANGKATLRISGTGFKVNGGSPQMGNGYSKSITMGTSVTVEYVGSDDFYYWKNSDGKIVSKEKIYTFTLVSNTSLTPVYLNSEGMKGYAFVEFVSAYGQVMQAMTYGSNETIDFPDGPSKVGGVFKGWSLDGETVTNSEEILEKIENNETYIRVTPLYDSTGSDNSLTVIVDNDTDNPYYYGEREVGMLTLRAPEIEGRQFAYWSDAPAGGNILGYSDTYSVLVRGDVILYAVYDEPDAVIERTPVIAITDVYTTVDDGVDKISFVATRNVPEGYTLREHGVLGGTDPEFGGTDGSSKLVLDGGDNVIKSTSSNTSKYGAYVFTSPIEDRNMTVYLRGYMIVTNTTTGQDETIYTDIIQSSFEDLQ